MRQIMISGWYGHGNSGDEAILSVFLDQMGGGKTCDIQVLTSEPVAIDRDYGKQGAHGVRHWEMLGIRGLENLLRGRLWRSLRLLHACDMFVFGGGSILRDNTTWRNLLRLLDDILLARLFGVPVFFYAIGVGPFRSWLGRRLIGFASRRATIITVRDETSARLLTSLGVPADRITVVTDPAFLLEDADPAQAARAAGLGDFLATHPKTLFVYPTDSLRLPPPAEVEGRLIEGIAAALQTLAEQDGYAIALIPLRVTGGNDDVATSRRIRQLLPSATACHVVEQSLPPAQIRALTQAAGINVAIRLHAMIYAASLGVPSVSLNYEPKVRANATRFGLAGYVVEPDSAMASGLIAAVRALANNMEQERAALADHLPRLREQARTSFTSMADILRRVA